MTSVPSTDAKTLLDAWLRLWNGDLFLAPDIVSDDFRLHSVMTDGSDGSSVRGADGLASYVRAGRSPFPDLEFAIEVPPLFDGAYLSVRWTATGTYGGGFPGAEAPPGTVVTFTGTDTLLVRDGRFAEYWLNSDSLHMLRQLKAL
ncbi:ester cyclase [Streptomyces sp. NPDC050264]|uniref:ester cyclase n=1 Tax=Streptomyces sp. NPDC050264 TaxID=3155038 RepID=UPI00341BA91E